MKRKSLSLLIMLALSAPLTVQLTMQPACAADAVPPPANADTADSYRYLRKLRSEAQRLSTPNEAGEADLRRSLEKYQAALDYLGTKPVAERASGYAPMQSEYVNLLIPMAEAYAKLGMKEQALSALERMAGMIWLPSLKSQFDSPSFASLRDEPRFKALVQTMALPERLYKTPAIATPYKEVLTTEEKVAGLSLFWAEARSNFAHFDHVPHLAWDQVYMDYLTKVIAAPTTRDYYLVMTQLAPLLQDGHTNIYMPDELSEQFYAGPPLRAVLVEDKVLVQHIGSEALKSRVRVGEEIVAIDGLPVRQYAEQRVAPFVSASTPQDKALRTYTYQLLAGDRSKPVTLRLRSADGAERNEVLERSGAGEGAKRFVFKMLPGQIAYISLDQFETDESVKVFEAALPEILKAKGLVIDVRRNGGGSTSHGLKILSYLSREPIATAASFLRSDDVYARAQGRTHISWEPAFGSGEMYRSSRKDVFTGPVAVLTGAQTFSAAEDFSVAFRVMKRGIIVGEPTGGSTGQPLFMDLPGGGKGRICVKRDVYPDGKAFVGKGVLPDVEAHQTVAGLRAGQDPVLERALAAIR
jgi:carboxyl-terminal processing protease